MPRGVYDRDKTEGENSSAPLEEQKVENQVLSALETIASRLNVIDERLKEVEQYKPKSATELIEQAQKELAEKRGDVPQAYTPESDVTLSSKRIAPKHRIIVDGVLGKQFAAWETYNEVDSTHFFFHVQVPEGLSSIPQRDRNFNIGSDIRSKAIPNADGENGVRQWCLLIRKNLNQFYTQNGIRSPFAEAGV